MKAGYKIRLRILTVLGILFILSLFGLVIDHRIGAIVMGICMFSFIFSALGFFAYDIISPAKVVEGINKQIDEAGVLSQKGVFLSFTLAMMGIGLFFVFISMFVWFKYYI